jgi:hypothetical protein
MTKTYKIYERTIAEKTVDYCEQCDFSSYGYSSKEGFGGAVCRLHQHYLETDRKHIPIPEWCKVDKCEYPYSEPHP